MKKENKPRQVLVRLEIFSASIIQELSIWTKTIFILEKDNNHFEFTRIRIPFILYLLWLIFYNIINRKWFYKWLTSLHLRLWVMQQISSAVIDVLYPTGVPVYIYPNYRICIIKMHLCFKVFSLVVLITSCMSNRKPECSFIMYVYQYLSLVVARFFCWEPYIRYGFTTKHFLLLLLLSINLDHNNALPK